MTLYCSLTELQEERAEVSLSTITQHVWIVEQTTEICQCDFNEKWINLTFMFRTKILTSVLKLKWFLLCFYFTCLFFTAHKPQNISEHSLPVEISLYLSYLSPFLSASVSLCCPSFQTSMQWLYIRSDASPLHGCAIDFLCDRKLLSEPLYCPSIYLNCSTITGWWKLPPNLPSTTCNLQMGSLL